MKCFGAVPHCRIDHHADRKRCAEPELVQAWLEFDDDYGLVLEDWGGPVEIELKPGKLAPEPDQADGIYWQDLLSIARETNDGKLEGRGRDELLVPQPAAHGE